MVEERVKLLHGLGLERENSLSEWDEGERARGALVEEEAWLTRGVREGYVALSFYALDTHGCALADRPRVGRGLSGVLTWQDLTWSLLTRLAVLLS